MKTTKITGKQILHIIKTGSSHPVVVEDEQGDRYLVKLRESLSSPFASISDFICCKLGLAIGLPVLEPVWMVLEPGIKWNTVTDEIQDMVKKSFGYNIAFPFFEKAVDVQATAIKPDNPLILDLFCFDLLLLNIDRSPYNTNVIHTGKSLYAFDYETSMLVMGSILGKNYKLDLVVLQRLRESPFFRPNLTQERLIAMQTKLAGLQLNSILAPLPDDSFPNWGNQLSLVKHGLTDAFQNPKIYLELLKQVNALIPETEDDRHARISKNRKAFERRL